MDPQYAQMSDAHPAAVCCKLELSPDVAMPASDEWSPTSQDSEASALWLSTRPAGEAKAAGAGPAAAWVEAAGAAGGWAEALGEGHGECAWSDTSSGSESDDECYSPHGAPAALCDGLLALSPAASPRARGPAVARKAPPSLLEDLAARGAVYDWCTVPR
jgi:hypothetical protein